jgi:hypothetical protein
MSLVSLSSIINYRKEIKMKCELCGKKLSSEHAAIDICDECDIKATREMNDKDYERMLQTIGGCANGRCDY